MPHTSQSDGEPADDVLGRFERGDESAAEEIVEAYYERLVRLARKRLQSMPPQVADEEGAVVSALRSFFSAVQDGQFRKIHDEDDLWRLLATITARKAIRQLRVYWKQSGEANRVRREQDVQSLLSVKSSPEEEALLLEEFRHRIESLSDETLREIALMKLEGCENQEIADRLKIHVRSVQRKLKLIESQWIQSESE